MQALAAELERDLVSRRTMAARGHERPPQRAGRAATAWSVRGVHLEEDAAEQATPGDNRELRAAVLSWQVIADEFNHRGIKAKTGRAWDVASRPKGWHRSLFEKARIKRTLIASGSITKRVFDAIRARDRAEKRRTVRRARRSRTDYRSDLEIAEELGTD